MSDLITDEMVEVAAQALHDHRSMECRALHEVGQPLRDTVYANERRADARVALETAAPLIAAKVLNDTADEFSARLPDGTGNGRAYNSYSVAWLLRTRAQAALKTGVTND